MPFDARAIRNPPRVYSSESIVSTQVSLAEHNGTLYCGMLASTAKNLLSITSSENGLDFTPLRIAAPAVKVKQGVSLAYFEGYLCASFIVTGDKLGFIYSANCDSWVEEPAFITLVTGAPLLFAHNNNLWCIYNENGKIRLIYKDSITATWSNAVTMFGTPSNGTPIAATIFDDKLYYGFRTSDGYLNFGVYDFTNISCTTTVGTYFLIDSHPSLIVIENTLYCFFCKSGNIAYTTSVNGSGWKPPVITQHPALSPPAAIIYNHGLYFVFKSSGDSWSVVSAAYVLVHKPDCLIDIVQTPQQSLVAKTTQQSVGESLSLGQGNAAVTHFCYYLGAETKFSNISIKDRDAFFYTGLEGEPVRFPGAHMYLKYPNYVVDIWDPTPLTHNLILPGGTVFSTNDFALLENDFTISLMVKANSPGYLLSSASVSLELTNQGVLILRALHDHKLLVASSKPTLMLVEKYCYTITCTMEHYAQVLSIYLDGALITQSQTSVENDVGEYFVGSLRLGDGQLDAEFMNVGIWYSVLDTDDFYPVSKGNLFSTSETLKCFWPLNGSFADASGNECTLIPNSSQCWFDRCTDCHSFSVDSSISFSVVGPFPPGEYNISRSFEIPSSCKHLLVNLMDTNQQFPPQSYLSVTGPNNQVYSTNILTDKLYVAMAGDSVFKLEIVDPQPGKWKLFLQSTGRTFNFSFLALSSSQDMAKIQQLASVTPYRSQKFQPQYINDAIKNSKFKTLDEGVVLHPDLPNEPEGQSRKVLAGVFFLSFQESPDRGPPPIPKDSSFFDKFMEYNQQQAESWPPYWEDLEYPAKYRLVFYNGWIKLPEKSEHYLDRKANGSICLNKNFDAENKIKITTDEFDFHMLNCVAFVLSTVPAGWFAKSYAMQKHMVTLNYTSHKSSVRVPAAYFGWWYWNGERKLNETHLTRVLTHELLHLRGLKDLYFAGHYRDVGNQDIMGGSAAKCHPDSMLSYTRYQLNWIPERMIKRITYKPGAVEEVTLLNFTQEPQHPQSSFYLLMISLPERSMFEAGFGPKSRFICAEYYSYSVRIYGVNRAAAGRLFHDGTYGLEYRKTAHVVIYDSSTDLWGAKETFLNHTRNIEIYVEKTNNVDETARVQVTCK